MNFRRFTRSRWGSVFLSIVLFAGGFVIAMALLGLVSFSWPDWNTVLKSGCLFAVLGAYYGSIAALDGRSSMAAGDYPLLRTLLCSAFAAAAGLVAQAWPPATISHAWLAGGAAIGGVLGWIGWAWAKYISL
ncbi:hypothetical protein [Massilia sp. CCM 8734]|uniref:hypothetical protein n=1 Tax=Massilia sp. CCM 8734 TaxID=2609283 RepID=UPI00141DAA8A|nr:hypothetical protein [Massilia sp. CCM 8734]NIA00303.1 hypothetical protein [Massilia sp. CCM 8734]